MVLFYTNSHFQYISVPFERISLINFFSPFLPRGWGFIAYSHVNFSPRGQGFAAFLPGGGDFAPQKYSPGIGPGGEYVNSWNLPIH